MGDAVGVPPDGVPEHDPVGVELEIAVAISRAARHLPGRYRCLDEALAAQWMLRARGIPGTIVIGLRREGWAAHAWVFGRTGTLVGRVAGVGYTPVSAFRPR
jgi:hypothetical protein